MRTTRISRVVASFIAFAMILSSISFAVAQGLEPMATWDIFTYEPRPDGSLIITECDQSASGVITIPSAINGTTVSAIGERAFFNLQGITGVSMPGTIQTIGDYAFEYCKNLTGVTIPDGVQSIGASAFANTGIASVTLGSALTHLGMSAFSYCENLSSVSVAAGNTAFSAKDNVLYSFDGSKLIFCPAGKAGEVIVPMGVKSLEAGAFGACFKLTAVTLPYGVEEIGDYAFSECGALKQINIPNSVRKMGSGAFWSCAALVSIALPNSLTEIPKDAFSECTGLTSFHVPDGVSSIGPSAFYGCSKLISARLPEGLLAIGDGAFRDCASLAKIEIPASVTNVGSYAFMHASALRNANFLGNPPAHFGGNVFTGAHASFKMGYLAQNASQWAPNGENTWNGYPIAVFTRDVDPLPVDPLFAYTVSGTNAAIIAYKGTSTEVNIPSTIGGAYTVTAIDDYAFELTNITSVTIPDSVVSIGNSAFSNCDNLTSVSIGKGVSSIGVSAFAYCGKLNAINVSSDNKVYASVGGVLYSKDHTAIIACPGAKSGVFEVPSGTLHIGASAFESLSKLTAVNLPSTLKTIGDYAFWECSLITSFTIPNTVTSIGEGAFYACTSLQSVTLPGNLSRIEANLFSRCSALSGIVIPQTVKLIGTSAFYGCSALVSVNIPSKLETIEEDAFRGCVKLEKISISNAIQSVGSFAFFNCSGLNAVLFKGEPPAFFGSNVFSGAASGFKIYYLGDYKLSWAPDGETTWKGYPVFQNDALQGIGLSPASMYVVDAFNGIVRGVADSTSISAFLAQFESAASLRVADANGNAISDVNGLVATGYKVQLMSGSTVQAELVIVVAGDITGDGRVNSFDIVEIQKHLLHMEQLTGYRFMAADLMADDTVNSRDIGEVQKIMLNK